MDISEAIKYARLIIKKKVDDDVVVFKKRTVDVESLLEKLKEMEKANLQAVKTCDTCRYIEFGDRDEKAICYPKNYSSFRSRGDFCCGHKERGGK